MKTQQDNKLPTPEASRAVIGSAIRPHGEQTTLERVLRSHLWHPKDILERGKQALPKCVKAAEYKEAGEWQERIRKAEAEIKNWEYILELYEKERQSQNAPADLPSTKARKPRSGTEGAIGG